MTRKLVFCATTVALLAGCAVDRAQSASSSPPPASASASASPSASSSSLSPDLSSPSAVIPTIDRRPSGPPPGPSDQIKKTGWVVGTVTADSSGPCYGLVTDDGTQYALHATDGTKLVKGERVRVRTQTARIRIYCGPGRLVEMVAVEPVR